MSQTRSLTSRSVRETFRSFKSFRGKVTSALINCVRSIGDSEVSLRDQKLIQKTPSLRNTKPCPLSQNVAPYGDLKSSRNASQHRHVSHSGHERCPTTTTTTTTTREYSSFEVVSKRTDGLNLSLQIEPLLLENRLGSDVGRVNDMMSQGHNHGTATALTEFDVGASAAAPLKTTPSTPSSIKDVRSESGRNERETISGPRSSTSIIRFDTTSAFNTTTSRPRENRSSPNLHSSSESTNKSLPPKSPTLPAATPPNQSTIESVPPNSNLFDKLGIITGRPEKPEFAIEDKRRKSFEGWPSEHCIRPDDLAKAGFFYSGYSDSARCFYCSGGLRQWEEGEDVWVEHARWFPQCKFLHHTVGCAFIDVVQELKEERKMITYEDVLTEMKARGLKDSIPKDVKNNDSDLDQNTADKTLIDSGFPDGEVSKADSGLKQTNQTLTTNLTNEDLSKEEVTRKTDDTHEVKEDLKNIPDYKRNFKQEQETYERLQKEIVELRQINLCKICMDKKVSVVFLPCGHLISCQDCSYALQSCPICRDTIKGMIKAYLC